jgi:hypothetical protein
MGWLASRTTSEALMKGTEVLPETLVTVPLEMANVSRAFY